MIVKFCMLLETKGPRQQTKFDPQSGRGLRSLDHFYNFRPILMGHDALTVKIGLFTECLVNIFALRQSFCLLLSATLRLVRECERVIW